MKCRAYIRIGKDRGKPKFSINAKPNFGSLFKDQMKRHPIPTVQFAVDIDIADKEFDGARCLLQAKIDLVKPAIEIQNKEIEQ